MVKKYMAIKQNGLNSFLEELEELTNNRWKPIWETFTGNTTNEQDDFAVILVSTLRYEAREGPITAIPK